MGGLVDTVLDISDPAGFFKGLSGQTAAEGNALALDFQREGAERQAQEVERARNEIFGIAPAAMDASRQGFQGAIDVSGQAAPMQAETLLGGNVAAQEQLLAGLPQIQNALLGNAVDMSAFQPVNLGIPDFSFLNRQIPNQLDLNTLLTNPAGQTVTPPSQPVTPPDIGVGGFPGVGSASRRVRNFK